MQQEVDGAVWDRTALQASPLFHTVADLIGELPAGPLPGCAALNALADTRKLVNAVGLPLRFVPDEDGRKVAALDYENRIYRTGEVLTRPNWHDFFNALAWLAFPRSKALINRLHVEEGARQAGPQRSVARDVLTLFDEGGMLVASSDPTLAALLRDFAWKRLFWTYRQAVRRHMTFYVYGHAVHEKLLAPYRGITAKALIVPVEPGFFDLPPAEQLMHLDAWTVDALSDDGALTSTRIFQPVPVLGIPGWVAANAQAEYYDDMGHFRPGRRRRHERK